MRGLGREFGQGFHFARPMAGDEVTEFLTRAADSGGRRPGAGVRPLS